MLNILHAHTPPTRLSAMLTGRERAEHAARVVRAAEAGLLGADADPDRRDLAALLGAIGTAWESTTRSATSTLGEALRWSEACVLAERIAARWLSETAGSVSAPADGDPDDSRPGRVLDFNRDHIRRGT